MVRILFAVAVATLLALFAWRGLDPAGTDAPAADEAEIRARLADFGTVDDLAYLSEPDLYRARIGGRILYVTGDGRHMLNGELYDLDTRTNLTERAKTELRRDLLADLDPDTAITFPASGDRIGTVWVFTDIDCPYCQRFHARIDDYNARGIEVRYLAFPRRGPNSQTWNRTRAVWCADDPRAALSRAKSGNTPADVECDTDVVARHHALGRDIGLRGTPMIVTPDGRVLGGYRSPEALASSLRDAG